MKYQIYFMTLILIILFAGCSKGYINPVEPDREGMATVKPYVFVTEAYTTHSFGQLYYGDGVNAPTPLLSGVWVAEPILVGDYIYFIKYSGYYPKLITEPIRYTISTGVSKSLGSPSTSIMNLWIHIDAVANGTYLIGTTQGIKIYKNGSLLRSLSGWWSFYQDAELSDDGAYVAFIMDNKGYLQKVSSYTKKLILNNGYACEVATNGDGSKVGFITLVGSDYLLYVWSSAGLSKIPENGAWDYFLDMDASSFVTWTSNSLSGGQGSVYSWDGATVDYWCAGNCPVANGDYILFGGTNPLSASVVDRATKEITVLGSYGNWVEFCNWGR